jgi:hypothetical protein
VRTTDAATVVAQIGSVAGLTVTPPSLEDVYLTLIGSESR